VQKDKSGGECNLLHHKISWVSKVNTIA